MLASDCSVSETGIDAVALKPAECDVSDALDLPFDEVIIDYEGREHLPDTETLRTISRNRTVRLTTPVRADGFDPLGDAALARQLPHTVDRVFVAGHHAYLDETEAAKAIAPRLGAAIQQYPDAWVGTEGVERAALATGGTQFELFSRSTVRDVKSMRAAGFAGDIAVYAPTVLTDDEDDILDAVGGYAARRKPVRTALSKAADASDSNGLAADAADTDSAAAGRTREILSAAVRDYALVGTHGTIRDRVETLRDAGVDTVVGYPAQGVSAFRT